MSSFPILGTGTITLLRDPLQESMKMSTAVVQFLDGSEQRWLRRRNAIMSFTMNLKNCSIPDREVVTAFFISQLGRYGLGWDVEIDHVKYQNMMFDTDSLSWTEDKVFNRFTAEIPIKQSIPTLKIYGGVLTGKLNTYFSTKLGASGGSGVYTWSPASALPFGLFLSPDGELSGTPLMFGGWPFTVQVVDSNAATAQGYFTFLAG